jgi:histidinol-phosphate aminotransferase
MLRLSANESPWGPFPAAREAVARELDVLHRYPRPDDALVARLSALHGIDAAHFAVGNGADAIIGYLSTALLHAGDEVVMGWPSFPTYVTDAHKEHATDVRVPLRADGAMDLPAMAAAITPRTRLVWICTPNNPTGASVTADELDAFLDAVPADVTVIVDEAYFEFAAGPDHADALVRYVGRRPNVGVLRTFSKLYGLAGLRIGWFAGPVELAERLRATRHYYDVIDVAIAAALASLDDPAEVERRREHNRELRGRLEAGLDALGIEHLPSDANFVCAVVADAPGIGTRLADAGILVRPLDDLERPDLLRVSVGAADEIDRFLAALPDAVAGANAA